MSENIFIQYGERPFEKEADVPDWQMRYEGFSNKELRSEYWNYKSSDDPNGSKGMALAEIVNSRRGRKTIDRFFREADLNVSDLKAIQLYDVLVSRGYDPKTTDSLKLREVVIDSGYENLYAGSVENEKNGQVQKKGYTLPVSELDVSILRGFVKAKFKRAKEIKEKLNSGKSLK